MLTTSMASWRKAPTTTGIRLNAAAIMPTQADAQDVVSDAVEKLWRNRERMAGLENPRGFMITVVKRTALDALRH